jgi:tripartite-type tricarboxylate transporter receptor subunit TctC
LRLRRAPFDAYQNGAVSSNKNGEGRLRSFFRAAAVAAVAFGVCAGAFAQDYPTRTITLVVPYPPGGGVDAMARVVAEKLAVALGQQVVVENRAGGSGLVGTRTFIKSAPDGYTLFLGHTGSISINPSLYANAGFDPRKDFAPAGLIASMPVALLAHPSFPAKTISDVVAIAKKEGAKFNIGTSAVGTGGYLSAELFKSITGVDAGIIPYKGTGQVMNDLLGNHVPIAFGVLPPALGNLQAGTLRAIAVLSPQRFSLLPDVPTANESGLPGFESVLHYGVLAPAGTPRPIIDRLNAALRALVETEQVKQRILAEGGDPMTSTPEEYARDIDSEETKWGTLVRKLNLKVE